MDPRRAPRGRAAPVGRQKDELCLEHFMWRCWGLGAAFCSREWLGWSHGGGAVGSGVCGRDRQSWRGSRRVSKRREGFWKSGAVEKPEEVGSWKSRHDGWMFRDFS